MPSVIRGDDNFDSATTVSVRHIQTQEFSGAGSVTFSLPSDKTYRKFQVVLEALDCTSGGAEVLFQFGTSTSAIRSGSADYISDRGTGGSTSNGIILKINPYPTTLGYGHNMTLDLIGTKDANVCSTMNGYGGASGSSNTYGQCQTAGIATAAYLEGAFRIIPQSGTLSGKIHLFGFAE